MGISIKKDDFIYPYFVIGQRNKKQEIKLFPGIFRFSIDRLLKDIAQLHSLGLRKILLFGITDKKDNIGYSAYQDDNIVAAALRCIKKEFKDLTLITDVCLCAYTTHGHCGLLKDGSRKIDQERTLKALADMALSHADAGADWVAPSAMAKKQVQVIRGALDKAGLGKTKILGYSAKFASNFYGPFRKAADSSPKFGDRKGYQLDFADGQAALREIKADIREGADAVMVKPALSYLDVIKEASEKFRYPLVVFNVSGEYSLVKYGVRQGLWEEKKMVFEVVTSIKRAGADLIISYHAKDIARWI
ncbi:MAG: porphobilinogen synthase [Candidatus Omnitrophota bacterium]